jgi:hypothetical protein
MRRTWIFVLLITCSVLANAGDKKVKSGQEVTLKLREWAKCGKFRVSPAIIVEDSRCPEGTQCIWEGLVNIEFATGKEAFRLMPGNFKSLPSFGYTVALKDVLPHPKGSDKIESKDYRFVIIITKN